MTKRLLLTITFLGAIGFTANAQRFNIELNYQSFRPFIHFRLELGNRPRAYDPYQASYLRGYMDGVNGRFYHSTPYYERDRLSEAYDTGYQDGILDREFYCRLQGVRRLSRRPFAYDDYYAPYYSIQVWLNQVSFTFLRVPERRLPRHWARHAHRDLIKYRRRVHRRHQWTHFEKQYRNRIKHLKKRAHEVRRSRRKRGVSRIGKRPNRVNRSSHSRPQQKHRAQRVQRSHKGRTHRTSHRRTNTVKVKRQSHHKSQPKHTRSRRRKRWGSPHKSTPHKVKRRNHSRSTSHHSKSRSRSHSKSKSRSRSGHRSRRSRGDGGH